VEKGYPEQNFDGIKRFVRAGGSGIGDVVIAAFSRYGQIVADEVLDTGAPLVGKIEPAPHGGESQVDVQNPAPGEDIGIE
jgi:hypothetical protein